VAPFDTQRDPEKRDAHQLAQPATLGLSGPTESLPHQQTLESAFGESLSSIRVHRGPAAEIATRALDADAYAHRGQIVLGAEPSLKLVAEETAHVLQQRGRNPSESLGLTSSQGPAEREAQTAADLAALGNPIGPMQHDLSMSIVARAKKKKKKKQAKTFGQFRSQHKGSGKSQKQLSAAWKKQRKSQGQPTKAEKRKARTFGEFRSLHKGSGKSQKELGQEWKKLHPDGPPPAHGNVAGKQMATLYKKFDKDGDFRKHGITKHQDPTKRYTKKQIAGGSVVAQCRGPRCDMLQQERDLVETDPGPDNKEPWAGKRKKPDP